MSTFQILFIHQISKDLDKESEEYKWIKTILPTDYLNTLLDSQQQQSKGGLSDLASHLDSFTATANNSNSKVKSTKDKKKQSVDLSSSLNESSSLSANNTELLLNAAASDLANYLESLKVMIININDKGFDCPGMLSEEKVLQEYEYLNTSQSSLNVKDCNKRNVSDKMILDDRSSSDKLDNNQSMSSSDDNDHDAMMNHENDDVDEQEENEQDVADGLSEFNFSGRDTPIISGRDTPSSYSHEDTRRNSSNIMSSGNQSSNIMNITNMNYGGISSNLSRLPVTVHKENREDISDKFCKFEINKGKSDGWMAIVL